MTFAARILAAVLVLGVASPALADSRVAELNRRGHALMDAKRYAEALKVFDEALALEPDPALRYNRGRVLQFLGRYPEALEAVERFAAEAPRELLDRVPALPELLRELRALVGTLVVKCTIDGTRVLVDDRQVGTTPLAAPLRLSAGRVRVDAFAEGYFPFHREVEVKGGAEVALDIAPVSRQTSGILSVRSHVGGTQVDVDGRAAGLAPLEIGLRAGAYKIAATSAGHDDVFTQVVLQPGERKDVWLDPSSRPPIYAKWWFWTAIGAVVAGGVVTYVALTTEKSPSGGTYSPGVVRY